MSLSSTPKIGTLGNKKNTSHTFSDLGTWPHSIHNLSKLLRLQSRHSQNQTQTRPVIGKCRNKNETKQTNFPKKNENTKVALASGSAKCRSYGSSGRSLEKQQGVGRLQPKLSATKEIQRERRGTLATLEMHQASPGTFLIHH